LCFENNFPLKKILCFLSFSFIGRYCFHFIFFFNFFFLSLLHNQKAYALLVQPPMEENMYEMAKTAVFALREFDSTRDVVVMLVVLSEKDREVASKLSREFKSLGAVVIERSPLPIREVDKQMYYRFDYQKLYIWNLPHSRVMFLDSDMVTFALLSVICLFLTSNDPSLSSSCVCSFFSYSRTSFVHLIKTTSFLI
jgi:hypothetical protein